ncbi:MULTISPECIES: hypothetical protein [Clostridium]|uniref:hypothetical protein n=1 Tax=Clostridium TaxID=1485 RepID=UPI0002D1FC3C|nr:MULTISPECIES: hypothetical protein [Clostridium]ENZ31889.1 hypothetical protein HMPREF1084_02832 [Clostridium butyricum 60E.3]MDB2140094.1 hypothetical protein [Clostridium butyricum]MDU1232663.1 hypothetical protein [Clostridium sp.]MDU1340651.1 hypothetical protein [Clostridium butyricum]MDU3091779.1 hypothetical protein [Clostridium sp.]
MAALNVLINSINAQLEELNKAGYKLYDAENRDYFISKINYCEEDDRLIFDCTEDKE